MKYLSLLLLISLTFGQKYDVQTGSSNESFQAKGLKLKVIEELAVKNVKRVARKWILYPSAKMLGVFPIVGVLSVLGADHDYLLSGKEYKHEIR